MKLQVEIEDQEAKKILKVVGEVDAYTAPVLRERLFPLTEITGIEIFVDLSGVNYMDSTGLGTFVGALKSCRAHGCSLKLFGLSDRIERLFNITGLSDVIDVQTDQKVRGGSQ